MKILDLIQRAESHVVDNWAEPNAVWLSKEDYQLLEKEWVEERVLSGEDVDLKKPIPKIVKISGLTVEFINVYILPEKPLSAQLSQSFITAPAIYYKKEGTTAMRFKDVGRIFNLQTLNEIL